MLDVLVVLFAVFHYHRTKRHSAGTFQECITAMIRMVMFVLLLLCGDIESNPGPDEHQPMDTRQKKVHKIERTDTNEKIGISSSTLERLWIEVCSRWDDVTTDNFKLTEADGTELVDELYYQQLASKIPLQLRSKTKGTKSRSKYARVTARPLTDGIIHEIATNHTPHDIVKLGLAMGFTQQRISKYRAENATEPRAESRGTENMIMNWRQCCNDPDKMGAFCNVLQQAELNELADDLSNGKIYSRGDSHILTGPDGVEVVFPSMTSLNSDTKRALAGLTIRRVSTTFQCTERVIECNNLPEMPAEDLSRLTELIGKIPDHPLPIAAEVEAPTIQITELSADKIGTADNLKSIPVSEFDLGLKVAPTQPCRSRNSMTSSSSASIGDGNLRYMASATSQLGTCSSYTAHISKASSNVYTSFDRYPTQDKVIDSTYPIALLSVSRSSQHLVDGLRRQLPGKTIVLIKDPRELPRDWNLFEAILVDLGSLQALSSDKFNKMRIPQNIAMLVPAHSEYKHADFNSMISELCKTEEVPVFQYSNEYCRPSLFDDNTKNRLVCWLLDCYKRHHHAASLKKGPGFFKIIHTQFKSFF